MRLFLGEIARQPEVRYSYMTVFIEQNIRRLKSHNGTSLNDD